MQPIILILIGSFVITIGDLFFKQWVINSSNWVYACGMTLYLIGAAFLAATFKTQNIAVASVIFILVNAILLSLISWFYFKETLTPLQIFGMVLGLIGVIILEVSH